MGHLHLASSTWERDDTAAWYAATDPFGMRDLVVCSPTSFRMPHSKAGNHYFLSCVDAILPILDTQRDRRCTPALARDEVLVLQISA